MGCMHWDAHSQEVLKKLSLLDHALPIKRKYVLSGTYQVRICRKMVIFYLSVSKKSASPKLGIK